jgi:hypothetical protein
MTVASLAAIRSGADRHFAKERAIGAHSGTHSLLGKQSPESSSSIFAYRRGACTLAQSAWMLLT